MLAPHRTMKTLLLVGALLAAAGCRRDVTPAPSPQSSSSSSVAPLPPAVSVLPEPSIDASPLALPNECEPVLAATGSRRVAFRTPGDPASHPGCAMNEAGDLQCAEDFVGWTPRSRVKVPTADARSLLDDAERVASANGCRECPRSTTRSYPAGYDPSSYPARLCKGNVCVEVCEGAKERLRELRARFAATKRATTTTVAD